MVKIIVKDNSIRSRRAVLLKSEFPINHTPRFQSWGMVDLRIYWIDLRSARKNIHRGMARKTKRIFSIVRPPKNTIFEQDCINILLFYVVLSFVFCSFLSPFQIPLSRHGIIESSKGNKRTAPSHEPHA